MTELPQPIPIEPILEPDTGDNYETVLVDENGREIPQRKGAEDLSDLFDVPHPNDPDIYSEDLLDLDEEDISGGDCNDLFEVTRDDIIGTPTRHKTFKVRRLKKRELPMTGMQGLE